MPPESPTPRARSAAPPAAQRSAVSNGKRLHVVPPGDRAWARRFRDVLAEIISDLGGAEGMSELQRQLARRCATLAVACEQIEGRVAAGEEVNLDQFGQLTDRLGRASDRLGLQRQARDVTPDLRTYLHGKANGG